MFPAGAPGVALLVLRICICVALACSAFPNGWEHVAFLVLLGLLCAGLLTPLVCGIAVVAVLVDFPEAHRGAGLWTVIIVLSTSAYALLGPGAYSVDARLFGRRVVLSTDSVSSRDDD
jgi:hypothetical protein